MRFIMDIFLLVVLIGFLFYIKNALNIRFDRIDERFRELNKSIEQFKKLEKTIEKPIEKIKTAPIPEKEEII